MFILRWLNNKDHNVFYETIFECFQPLYKGTRCANAVNYGNYDAKYMFPRAGAYCPGAKK